MNNNKFTIDFNPTDFIIDLHTIAIPQKNTNNRLKLVAFSFISLIFITGSILYVQTRVSADVSGNIPISVQNNFIKSKANSVKMTASVSGWFKTAQISNERLEITTNMEVFVNGQKVAPINQITKNANSGVNLRF